MCKRPFYLQVQPYSLAGDHPWCLAHVFKITRLDVTISDALNANMVECEPRDLLPMVRRADLGVAL